jgi:hypothetical protein
MNSKDSSLSNSDSESTHTNVAKTKLPTDTKIIDEKVLGQGEEKYRLVFESIALKELQLIMYLLTLTPLMKTFLELENLTESVKVHLNFLIKQIFLKHLAKLP